MSISALAARRLSHRTALILLTACAGVDSTRDRDRIDTGRGAGVVGSSEGGRSPSAASAPTLWLLARDSANDALRATDTETSLIGRYGADNVKRAEIDQGEGMLVSGTILFPADSLRRLEIQWEDTVARSRPVQVTMAGRIGAWRITPGLGLGTPLADLERLNGGPFTLGGFGGHYPGVVTDWKAGNLSALDERRAGNAPRRAMIRLLPDEPYPPDVNADRYDRESLFLSSDPGMQRLQPRIVFISVHPR